VNLATFTPPHEEKSASGEDCFGARHRRVWRGLEHVFAGRKDSLAWANYSLASTGRLNFGPHPSTPDSEITPGPLALAPSLQHQPIQCFFKAGARNESNFPV